MITNCIDLFCKFQYNVGMQTKPAREVAASVISSLGGVVATLLAREILEIRSHHQNNQENREDKAPDFAFDPAHPPVG